MVDVRDNNGPFEIEPKQITIEIKGQLVKYKFQYLWTQMKNILNAF